MGGMVIDKVKIPPYPIPDFHSIRLPSAVDVIDNQEGQV